MSEILPFLRRNCVAIAVTALMLTTQFVVMIPNPVSLSGAKAFNLSEFPLLAIVAVVGWHLVKDRGWSKFSPLAHWLMGATVVMGVVWAVMIVIRKFVLDKTAIAITPMEFVVMGVAAYLLAERRRLDTKQVLWGLGAFIAITNLYAVVMVLLGQSIRKQGLMGNINYYIGVALMAIPILVHHAAREGSKAFMRMTIAVVGSSAAVVLLSGSRFGGVTTLLMLAATFVAVDPRPWRAKFRAWLVMGLIAVVTFGTLIAANRKQLNDVARTFNLASVATGEEPDTEEIKKNHKPTDPADDKPKEADRFTYPGDPDHDPKPPAHEPNILNHTRVTNRSVAVVADNWLLGTGRIGPYFSGYGYQPAHNIVMEAVLYLGAFGALSWFAVLLAGVPVVLRRRDRNAWLLGFAGLFAFSMFQPLLSDAIVTLLPMWLLLHVAVNRPDLPTAIAARKDRDVAV